MQNENEPRNPLSAVSMHDSGLTTEQTAAAFARFSRSPETVAENAAETKRANTARFHSKWTLDYGHSSIAEHAPVQLAVENISRVACDLLESGRLASYTEKSSRFQSFNAGQFAIPAELDQLTSLRRRYVETCTSFMEDALRAEQAILEYLQAQNPDGPNLRRQARDAARGILPAAVFTSLGLTANARSLAHAISKLLSHPLQEAQQLGHAMKEAAESHIPTLLRRADPQQDLAPPALRHSLPPQADYQEPQLLSFNPGAERIICAALLYSQGMDFQQAEETAQAMPPAERGTILSGHLERAGKHGHLPREFELASCRIGLTVDYGALRELNRHRLQTNLNQPLHTALGPNVPELAARAGVAHIFAEAALRSHKLHRELKLQLNEHAAQYAVLHCHWQRTQVNANLRQLHNLLRLRTRENVHPALRREMLLTLALCHETHPAIFPQKFA